ncbi:acyl-CoA dehydrogenase [Microvenator marinus]|jgi:alkylation response protein AidB-like acyl-CoA dehydrogenase|uniref:Short/branched chain specific acyl-CoA dehydrogenase, mitochondrial n=1 Tax=Microvenator marinus TaxID=2600177 RepID=A0A5B8XQ10_9DELT|nr:acyl-CoA dehydrogenase [Microvenator marinus]QED27038.1 acyl-CoA dehydrogenase [Microvenator marinus]
MSTPLTVLSEDEIMFQQAVRDWARKEVAPKVHAMDQAGQIDKSIIKGAFDLGLMGIEVPGQYGGSESSFMMAILAIEEIATIDPSVSVFVDVQNTLVNNAIHNFASDALKEKYFPKLCSEWVGSYALSEPASGSDAFALQTRAEDCGDHWKLNGTKLWITNGAEASFYIVFANIDPSKGYRGITGFLVEREFEGFSVGKKEDKLGIRASSTTELIMENCIVPKENVLGEVGKGYKVAIETLNEGRIGIGAQMIGLAKGAFDGAMAHMMEREQFGQKIAEFQGLQFQYAEVATRIEAARLMVYNAARLKDAGKPFVKEAAMAKLYSSQVAEYAASKCVEFHGGVGFTKEFLAEKFYRDAKIGTIYEGTSNMQLQTIAKLLLSERS